MNMIGKGKPGPGRPKGLPNKTTQAIKEMVVEALKNKGGVKYFEEQADKNPTAFMALVGKVIPLTMDGKLDGTYRIIRESVNAE